MFGYCLADFFNLGLWPIGRPANHADIRDGLDDLVRACFAAGPSMREITVRLYGGWNGPVPESRVTLRDLTESVLRNTPMRLGRTRLRFQLAETPIWDKSLRLLRTVRHSGVRHIHASISVPDDCPNGGHCSLVSFKAWCVGACPDPSCSVALGDVATRHRQKMVDTLMTADALTIAHEGMADVVLVATDDSDLLPGLLALKDSDLQAIHLTRSGHTGGYYRGILERDGVLIHQW